MPLTRAEMVRETTLIAGTGPYNLAGAVTGFQSFISGVGDGATVRYMVTDGVNWEVNEGVVSSGSPDTLTRGTLIASSSGSAINWGDTTAKVISLVMTADELNDIGSELVQLLVFDYTTDTEVVDGAAYFHIPAKMNGMNLVYAHAKVITAGTGASTDIQIRNVTDAVDMLTTKLTIDAGTTGSDAAATPYQINTSLDDVATNDLIAIDVDNIGSTAAKGLIVTLEFRLP